MLAGKSSSAHLCPEMRLQMLSEAVNVSEGSLYPLGAKRLSESIDANAQHAWRAHGDKRSFHLAIRHAKKKKKVWH